MPESLLHPPRLFCVYGAPDAELAALPGDAHQTSPLVPGAAALEDLPTASVATFVVAAPPGTLERRYALALALRALKPGARLTVMAPKDKGGTRLAKELEAFGCVVSAGGRRHQRICDTTCPDVLSSEAKTALEDAIEAGQPRYVEALDLWSQPGVFSWDRPDPGTELLRAALPPLSGRGADLGCGLGVLARTVLANPGVTHLDLIDIDRRAVTAAQRNVADPRAGFHWADVRHVALPGALDFIVMNPPFHDGGIEDRSLGQAFVRRSHQLLRGGGTLWLVANRHLPYEGVLAPLFTQATLRTEGGGFKIYEAVK